VGELLRKSEDDLLAITNFGQKSLDEVKEKLTSGAWRSAGWNDMPATPKKGNTVASAAARQHQRLMMANLVRR
jgi:hypothetical protein